MNESDERLAREVRRLRLLIVGILVVVIVGGVVGAVLWERHRDDLEKERTVRGFRCSIARERGDVASIDEFCD